DLLKDVLERDETRRATEFVDHDRQVRGTALEVPQLAVERLALRYVRCGPHNRLPARPSVGVGQTRRQWHEVLGEHDHHAVVRGPVVYGQPRMLALAEPFDDVLARR